MFGIAISGGSGPGPLWGAGGTPALFAFASGPGIFGVFFFLRELRVLSRCTFVGDLVPRLADMLARVLAGVLCRYCFAGTALLVCSCLCVWPVCLAILVCFNSVLYVPVRFCLSVRSSLISCPKFSGFLASTR